MKSPDFFYRDIKPEDLPAPDRQSMQLISYALKDDADMETLARFISVNPALTAQLIGLVNSAFFGLRHRVDTVSEAVVAIGLDSLRNLVLCFAVKEALTGKNIPGLDIDIFWEDSLRRAVAAKLLADIAGFSAEEAFTAGMVQDMGLVALFFREPEKADRWPLLRSNLPCRRLDMEEKLFHAAHDSAGALMARKWNLPESYIMGIADHHRIFQANGSGTYIFSSQYENNDLAKIMYLADLCNAVYTVHDKSEALSALKDAAQQLPGFSSKKLESLLVVLPDQVAQMSEALNMAAGPRISFDMVMEQVNKKLVEDNISYQELTWRLQKTLKQRDQYAAKLEAELDVARQIQKSLQPDMENITQVAAFNIPAMHLSGDFYDYFKRDDGTICFCIGDVSGKGTAAALLMAKAISLFRCLCKVTDDICFIVQLMNNELCETAVRGMFVTFAGGWLYPGSGRVDIVNAGHMPPFLVSGRKITRIDPDDPPLGVLPDIGHPPRQIYLNDSRLYLYTDGFTEGKLKKNSGMEKKTYQLGLKGFLRWLVQSGHMPVRDQADWLMKQCRLKMAPRSDDLTFMVLAGN